MAAVAIALAAAGCNNGPSMANVSGSVTLDGKPLEFGYVVFQPAQGQPAQGEIADDGAFTLSSFKPGDGAQVGSHKVTVLCYQGHSPAAKANQPQGHVSLGASLIPLAYTRSGMSGLRVDVPAEGLDGYVIELSSKGPGG